MEYYFLGLIVILVGLIGILSVYNGADSLYNGISTILVLTVMGLLPVVYEMTLSNPRNIDNTFIGFDKAEVIGYKVDYGNYIYYWFMIHGDDRPSYYAEPWGEGSKRKVQNLQKKEEGTLLYEPSLKKSDRLHDMPPQALPPKVVPEDTSKDYDL